jgi:hypothetical protein
MEVSGDLTFQWDEVVAVFEVVPAILDPAWGLERMIAALAHVPSRLAGPLPRY